MSLILYTNIWILTLINHGLRNKVLYHVNEISEELNYS